MNNQLNPSQSQQPSGLTALFGNLDKTKAFKQARRHSYFVKFLRLVMPLGAIAVLAYSLMPLMVKQAIPTGLNIGTVKQKSLTNYVMRNPKYRGFDKKNGDYLIEAASAEIDIKNSSKIPLNVIKVNVTHIDKTTTFLKAKKGLFNRDKKQMDLAGDIQLHNSTGMSAFLKTAHIDMTTKDITSNEAVRVLAPQGKITANALKINSKTKHIQFINNVQLFMVPPVGKKSAQKPEKPNSVVQKKKTNSVISGMSMDRTLPIEARSNTLTISDQDKTALLTGNVAIKQGVYDLLTNQLQINYAQPAKAQRKRKSTRGGMPAVSGKINSLHATNGIVIYTADGRSLQGEDAKFNLKNNRVVVRGSAKNKMTLISENNMITAGTLTMETAKNTVLFDKNVVAQMGKNEIKSDRLFLNTKTSLAKLDGKVRLKLYNNKPAKKKSKKSAKTKTPEKSDSLLPGNAVKMDPSKPLLIESNHLVLNDKKKVAIFSGKVVANQDTFSLRSEKLTAHYTGKMQPMPAPALKQTGKKSNKKKGSQIKKIIANKKVLMTTEQDQTVSGNRAEFDAIKNIATVSGDVIISQKGNILKGEKLVINLNTGQYKLYKSKKKRLQLLVIPENGKGFKIPR